MSETTKAASAAEESGAKKVVRRGIAAARGTTRLKFNHNLAKPNGLFIAHLDNVEIRNISIGEDKTGMPSFNGMELPKLVFTFASNEEDVNKRHYVTLEFMPVESNAETIPGGKNEWRVNSVFDWLKHILNVFVLKGRELNEEEEAALSLSYIDFDEDGNYSPVEAEEVVAAWRTLFENFENIMNRGKEGQPYYKDKNNKNIPIWIKLISSIKTNKGWKSVNNGALSFPGFVGSGCVERYIANQTPSITLDFIRESIIPKETEKPKAPNMPTAPMGMGGMMGGVPIADPMANMGGMGDMTDISAAAAEDMPF